MTKRNHAILLAAATLLLVGRCYAASEPIPEQVDKLKLLMTVDEARKLYPEMTINVASASNSNPPPPFYYAESKLPTPVKFGDLGPCDVSARYYEQKLFQFSLDCHDQPKIEAYLKAHFGQPQSQEEGNWTWKSPQANLAYSPKGGRFTLSNPEGEQKFNLEIIKLAYSARAAAQAAGATPSPQPQK